MKEPDADGRYPLYVNEYEGIKAIAGAYDQFIKKTKPLNDRVKVAGLSEEWDRVKEDMNTILTKLCTTIPAKKLEMIRKDMSHAEVYLKVTNICSKDSHDTFRYVDERDVDALLDRISEYECWCCEKKGSDYKGCSLYKAIDSLHPYEFKEQSNKLCPFAGGT